MKFAISGGTQKIYLYLSASFLCILFVRTSKLLALGFGAPTQDVFGFDVVMMIGAGIGFTPFAAILKDLHFRRESIKLLNPTGDMHFKLQRVYSYWMNREQVSGFDEFFHAHIIAK